MPKASSNSKVATPLTCPHCAGPLSKHMETSYWTVSPLIRDSFSMAPPVIVFSSACAGLAGGAVPALAQLGSSSYHRMLGSLLCFLAVISISCATIMYMHVKSCRGIT